MTFTWEWALAGKDVGFEGFFEPEGEDAQYPTLVAKWTRHNAQVRAAGHRLAGRTLAARARSRSALRAHRALRCAAALWRAHAGPRRTAR